MKKYLLSVLPLALVACSTPKPQQSNIPMDMKAVQEYQQRIASGNTVNPNAKQDDRDLNHSDRVQKVNIYHHHARPMIYPSLYYHHGWRSGLGVGFGYY